MIIAEAIRLVLIAMNAIGLLLTIIPTESPPPPPQKQEIVIPQTPPDMQHPQDAP